LLVFAGGMLGRETESAVYGRRRKKEPETV
jgi:hypothetical protein